MHVFLVASNMRFYAQPVHMPDGLTASSWPGGLWGSEFSPHHEQFCRLVSFLLTIIHPIPVHARSFYHTELCSMAQTIREKIPPLPLHIDSKCPPLDSHIMGAKFAKKMTVSMKTHTCGLANLKKRREERKWLHQTQTISNGKKTNNGRKYLQMI